MKIIFLGFLSLFFFYPVKICLTTNDGPQKNASCILPFKFKGKLKSNCINDQDPDGRFWCSTKVDNDLNHIGGQGNWGYCGSSCPTILPKPPPNGVST